MVDILWENQKMNDIYSDDEWKQKLLDFLIASMNGDESVLGDIGYYYQCYAPTSIYKYYPDTGRKLNEIKENKMWYSAPSKFNDPFDCEFLISEEELFHNAMKNLPDKRGIRPGSPIWKKMRGEMKRQVRKMQAVFDNLRYTTGVACFSERDNSLLMWAHYANNHKGMCVEYELMKFNTELRFSLVPVLYSANRESLELRNIYDIENVGKETRDYYVRCLFKKSADWDYEEEWRIVRDQGASGPAWDMQKQGALLDSIRPNSIILGCESEADFTNAVKEYCNESKINLYKMEKDKTKYSLNKKAILQFDTDYNFF